MTSDHADRGRSVCHERSVAALDTEERDAKRLRNRATADGSVVEVREGSRTRTYNQRIKSPMLYH
jgi:hypothetical protein